MRKFATYLVLSALLSSLSAKTKRSDAPSNPLDRYVSESETMAAETAATTPRSIWLAGSRLGAICAPVRSMTF